MSGFQTITSFSNNEISYSLRKTGLSSTYIDIDVFATSVRWSNFDVVFEYRNTNEENWKNDAAILFTSANTINYNKVYGLQASSVGYSNTIRWEYVKNNLIYGSSTQVRVRILPRVRNFNLLTNNNSINENYGISGTDLVGYSKTNIFTNVNNYGQYICLSTDSIKIFNELTDSVPVYTYSLLSSPSHAIQIDNDHYIICDFGNNRVIEMDSTLSTILYVHYILTPLFVDYDNLNNLSLVTSHDLNAVYEINLNTSTIIWDTTVTTLILDNPQSATYMLDNSDSIVISDYGNNRIIDINKVSYLWNEFTNYKIYDGVPNYNFYHPYRVFKMDDSKYIGVEQDGKVVDFNYAPEFLSSSSSNSSSSSTWIRSTSSSSLSSSSLSSSTSSSSSSSTSSSSSSTEIRSTSSSSSNSSSTSSSSSSTSSSSTEIMSTSSSSTSSSSTSSSSSSTSSSSSSTSSSSSSTSSSSSSTSSSSSSTSSSSTEIMSTSSSTSSSTEIRSTSSNSSSSTSSSSSSSQSIGNILFIAVGSGVGDPIAYSDNGINWEHPGNPIMDNGKCICYNETIFVAGGNGANTLTYSYNGIDWYPSANGNSIISSQCNGVCWNGTIFVAVGYGTNKIAWSYDGITWVASDNGNSIFSSAGYGVCWVGDKFVAVGTGTNGIAWSSDGDFWDGLGTSVLIDGRGVCKGGGSEVVAVGYGSTHNIAVSVDGGFTWTGITGHTTFSGYGFGICWGPNGYVATGYGANGIARSLSPLSSWTGLGTSIIDYGLGVCSNGVRYVIAGQFNSICGMAYSDNGTSWTRSEDSTFSNIGNGVCSVTAPYLDPPI